MPRRRSRARGRRYYDDEYFSSPPRYRRGGCLAPIRRLFHTVATILLIALGAIVFFLLVLLIAFNFALFVQLLTYALFVAAGLAILGVGYLVIRMLTAMSHRLSAASIARSQARRERERARIERERVHQAHQQVQLQHVKLAREEAVFAQQQDQRALPGPRRTRVIRDDPFPMDYHTVHQSPYRTRNLREYHPEPLVRVLPALSTSPPQAPVREETELERLGMPSKGQTFAYREYRSLLTPGHLFLGIRKDGSARIGSWQDLKILLLLGSSASGKTTTVLEKCVCHVAGGGQLVICDPGGEKPDSLLQRMGPLTYALMPGTTLAVEHADIMANLECFRQELERRRRGGDMSTPVLLIMDELNGLLMDASIKKHLTALLMLFGMQARNYHMYLILCAQRASGLADIRHSMISFICHKCPEMEAAKILPARYARLAPQLGVGQTFVLDANGEIEALQQIFLTKEDVTASVAGMRFPAVASPPSEPIMSRTGRPPRRHTTPSPPQKGGLHRTHLIQSPSAPAAHPPHIPPPAPPPPVVGATWGEAVQAHPAEPTPPPTKTPLRTEELVSRQPVAGDLPTKRAPQRQDTFEMLALIRKKPKKNE